MAHLDSRFVSAAQFHRAFQERARTHEKACPFRICLGREDGSGSAWESLMIPGDPDALVFAERSLKFLLWARGGNRIHIAGDRAIFDVLASSYAAGGARAFDDELIGRKIFAAPLQFTFHEDAADLPSFEGTSSPLGRHLDGCRIGFDLGGSDRKTAA